MHNIIIVSCRAIGKNSDRHNCTLRTIGGNICRNDSVGIQDSVVPRSLLANWDIKATKKAAIVAMSLI